jgi:hypothetical protein
MKEDSKLITENPITENPITENPITENPITENPILENPILENPILENPILDEMLANEESAIKELSTAHNLPVSKLHLIIANIKTSLEASDYSFPDDYAIGLMRGAFEYLPKKQALEFLEAKDLTRQVQKPMLFEALVNELRSQLSIEELIKQCIAVKKLLETHKDYIIQTGLLPERLEHEPWLESFFLRFYDTKKTTSKYPSKAPKAPFTFIPINPFSASKSTPCKYDEASQIEGLSERHETIIEESRPLLFNIAIEVITLIESLIKGTYKPDELEKRFIYAITRRLRNENLAYLLIFDQKFSTDKRICNKLNPPLVINSKFSSYLQSDGLLSNLANLIISVRHNFFDNPLGKAFANPKYEDAFKQLKETKSSPYLGSSYFESLPQTTEVTELLNLIESKGESFRSIRNLSIELMNKKLRAERIKRRKRLITRAMAPKCKNQFVFDVTKVNGSSTWNVRYKGKVIGGKPIKNAKGFILIRTLLTNRGKPIPIKTLHNITLSFNDPKSTKEPRFREAEINFIASEKNYTASFKDIAKLKIQETDLKVESEDPYLSEEERENRKARLIIIQEKLTLLEENAATFKQKYNLVYKQIKDSLTLLERHSLELVKHLEAIRVENGSWVYDPEVPIDWI